MEMPPLVYYLAGAIILTNIGTIISLLFAALKASWWLSKLDSRVSDAKNSAIRAHTRIDLIEGKRR